MASSKNPWTKRVRQLAKRGALNLGWRVERLTTEEERYLRPSHRTDAPLPQEAQEVLRPDHPELESLRRRYAATRLPVVAHSIWSARNLARDLDLRYFRGDNPYVWQYRTLRGDAAIRYHLYLREAERLDALGLLQVLKEDGAFGCWTFDYMRREKVSRDLLDSVLEINFLDRHLGLSKKAGFSVVDVGAGYGRLAHRMVSAMPNLTRYYCLDAIAESTYLCNYYLRFRDCGERASAIPLDQIEELVPRTSLDVAVNIHSFSECTLDAIRWWVGWLSSRGVQYLLIVPNDPHRLLSKETDGTRLDFAPVLAEAGYRLKLKQPVLEDADVRELVGVGDHFFLYHLAENTRR